MLRVLILAIVLSSASVTAQESKKADPPKLADVLRENENLKRENSALKRDLRIRDTHVQLAARERTYILEELSTDKNEPAAAKARCEALEVNLRELDKPDKDSTFECESMTFKKVDKK